MTGSLGLTQVRSLVRVPGTLGLSLGLLSFVRLFFILLSLSSFSIVP